MMTWMLSQWITPMVLLIINAAVWSNEINVNQDLQMSGAESESDCEEQTFPQSEAVVEKADITSLATTSARQDKESPVQERGRRTGRRRGRARQPTQGAVFYSADRESMSHENFLR